MSELKINRDALLGFLKSDTRYQVRTLSAIAYRFGCTLAEVDAVVGSAPGAFTARTGRMGVLLGAA